MIDVTKLISRPCITCISHNTLNRSRIAHINYDMVISFNFSMTQKWMRAPHECETKWKLRCCYTYAVSISEPVDRNNFVRSKKTAEFTARFDQIMTCFSKGVCTIQYFSVCFSPHTSSSFKPDTHSHQAKQSPRWFQAWGSSLSQISSAILWIFRSHIVLSSFKVWGLLTGVKHIHLSCRKIQFVNGLVVLYAHVSVCSLHPWEILAIYLMFDKDLAFHRPIPLKLSLQRATLVLCLLLFTFSCTCNSSTWAIF